MVDLWASSENSPNYGADTLHTVFSSGKSVEALLFALLVDKGLLDYNDKVRIDSICHRFPENCFK